MNRTYVRRTAASVAAFAIAGLGILAIDTMPAGWVNVTSSFRTFANCWDQHWEDAFQGGDHVGYTSSRSNIGALMDNKTSSQRWS